MDIAITIISSLISGIIATLITVNYYKRQKKGRGNSIYCRS